VNKCSKEMNTSGARCNVTPGNGAILSLKIVIYKRVEFSARKRLKIYQNV